MTVVSLWRNDAARQLGARVRHLATKRSDAFDVNWLWVVGDSTDATERLLEREAAAARVGGVKIVHADTGIEGEDLATRRVRLAQTATVAFSEIPAWSDLVLLHESDLVTPKDVIEQFWGTMGGPGWERRAVAGWPLLEAPEGLVFYDTFAYRTLDGRNFGSAEPIPEAPIEVGSFGCCWLAPASLVRGRTMGPGCVVDLCGQWRAEGVRLWVDPSVDVVQPPELWVRS